ncbi:MAG: RNA polymerase sigma factor [Flavobacteriales bacterium]|nr:RNA polymerase sigma factor [Flavobacteriales bacterium]
MTVSEFNKCIDDYSDGIYRFILKNCKDENIAKDIVQDSFEKFWLKKNDIQKGKEKSYLFTVAYHTFIDYKRKEKENKKLNEIEEKNYCDTNQYNDIQEQLHKALDLLPEIQKSVLLLRDYEGYSYQEIAEITLLNESQVKVYIFRARKFLQQYIGSIEQLL